MRRLSNVFLKISAILGIVVAVCLSLTAILFFVLGSPALKDEFMENYTGNLPPEEGVAVIQGMLIGFGVWFLITAALAIASAVVSSKARDSQDKTLLIWAIVLGALSLTEVGIAGGIIGIIATDRERRSGVINA